MDRYVIFRQEKEGHFWYNLSKMKIVSSSSANSNSLPKLYAHNLIDKDFALEVVADIRAQVTVSPPSEMKELGLSENNPFKPLTGLQHVGSKQLTKLGITQ